MSDPLIPARYWLWLVPLLVAVSVIWLLGAILAPFVVAAALAYIGDPFVDRLEAWRLPRTAAVITVFAVLTLGIALLVLLLFPLLEQQVRTLVENMPRYLRWLQERLQPLIDAVLPEGQTFDLQVVRELVIQHWSAAGGVATATFQRVFSSGSAVFAFLVNLVLIPVIAFYMLRDWDYLVGFVRDLLPRRALGTVSELARETDAVLGQFIRGQLLVMFALGMMYTVGLYLVGLDLAVLIGVGAGLVSFVPYLGVIVGLVASVIAMLVQTGGDLLPLIWVGLVFAVGQMVEGAILQPLLLGDRIGLHPVTVIFAVLAGAQLFGFIGVLIALPVAAAIAVLVRFAGRRWRQSRLYLDNE